MSVRLWNLKDGVGSKKQDFLPKMIKELYVTLVSLGMILENKVYQKLKWSKNNLKRNVP